MKQMNIKIYVFLFISLFSFCFAGELGSQLKYTFNKDQLTHAGLVRLSDIFFLIDEFDYYSIDGFTWQATPKDYDFYQQQNWILMVNGQTIQTKMFDTVNLNLLPYSPDQIDSIEIFVYPQQIEGEFSDKGIIHLYTRSIKKGLTLQGQFTAGNRTGDPGPYRYTEYWSENIDRIAADESYWLSYADTNAYIGIGHYVQMHYPTDPRMADRLRDIYVESNPYIKSKSFSIRAGLTNILSHPKLEIFQTTMEDLYFFKPAGHEIPTNHNFFFVGLSGGDNISSTVELNYRLFYQNHRLDNRPNSLKYDFDWGMEKIGGNIKSGFYNRINQCDFGIEIIQLRANTGYVLSKRFLLRGKFYGSYHYYGFLNHKPGLAGMFELGDSGQEIKLSVSDQYTVSESSDLTGVLSYSETSTLKENTLWYWSNNGYDFVNDIGSSYEIEGSLIPASQWTFDLTLKRAEKKWPTIEGGLSFRRFLSKNWELQPLTYNPNSKTVSGPVFIKTNASISRSRFFIKFDYRGPITLIHHLYYHYSTSLESSSIVHNLWRSIPEHRINYRIAYTPVDSFSIWSMLQYKSSAFWYDYRHVNKGSKGEYSAQLSDIISLDLAVNKWLWHKQIKVDVIFRNIFNRENIYFPIGASFDLRFYAQAEIYFNFM